MIPIGQKIKEARKEKKLTQEELADSNISRSLISLIENDLSFPSMQTLEYLSTKLGKHVSYFLVEDDTDSINLIIDLEYLLDTEEYIQIINQGENFIKYKLSTMKDTKKQYLGVLSCILGIAYYKTNNRLAFEYLNNSIDYLKSEGNTIYISKSYNYLGLIMYKDKNYIQMEHYLKLADSCINIITFENINQKLNILYNLSLAYYYQHKYGSAIEILLEALGRSKKYELFYSFGEFNMLLALSYKNMDKIDDSIECSIRSVKYYKLTENKYMEHRCYINLAMLFRLCNDQYNSLNYINDAIIYFQSIGDDVKLINAKIEKVISMYIFNSDCDLIQEMADSIMVHPKCTDTSKGEAMTILASLKLRNKDYVGSLYLYKEAEKLLLDNNDTEVNIFIFHGLHTAYDNLNDIGNANLYLAKLRELLEERSCYKRYLKDNKLFVT